MHQETFLTFQDELANATLEKMDCFGAKLSDLHKEMLAHDWRMGAPDGFVEKFKKLGEEMQLLEEGVKHATETMASLQSGSMHIRKEGNQAFQKFNEANKPVVRKSLSAGSKTHAIPAAFRRGVN